MGIILSGDGVCKSGSFGKLQSHSRVKYSNPCRNRGESHVIRAPNKKKLRSYRQHPTAIAHLIQRYPCTPLKRRFKGHLGQGHRAAHLQEPRVHVTATPTAAAAAATGGVRAKRQPVLERIARR